MLNVCIVLRREGGGDKKLVLVLLADTTLMQLPLEALDFLHCTNITAVCRDFSLQMLHYRMAKFQNESSGKYLGWEKHMCTSPKLSCHFRHC